MIKKKKSASTFYSGIKSLFQSKKSKLNNKTSQTYSIMNPEQTASSQSNNEPINSNVSHEENKCNNSIIDILKPLQSININSELHSFYNFKELKNSAESLLKAQSNLVFYVLHQNFMCDEIHKDFFKNIVGRFYDLPEKYWDYYRGNIFLKDGEKETIIGLVLSENASLFKRYRGGEYNFFNHLFSASNERKKDKFFNQFALGEYHGLQGVGQVINVAIYTQCENTKFLNKKPTFLPFQLAFEPYEFGRFKTNIHHIDNFSYSGIDNHWFVADYEYIKKLTNINSHLNDVALYASLGLENKNDIIQALRERAAVLKEEFKEAWIPKFDDEKERKIRSLSQTFHWTKEYIFNNADLLDLDILGLNMSVPWDMELVKFFINNGYGGRMSENKAVYEKVFEPILTDEILDKLFKCEYEKY